MAIDGVKIIDSDSAHDIYNNIMEMYNYGESIENIKKEIDNLESDFTFNDLEYEFYTTAYALAMWEIGGLSETQLQNVRMLAEKGASEDWCNIDKNAQSQRQKEIEKLLKKIEQPNLKIKKRKKRSQIKNYIFQPNDVLAFQLENGMYGITFLIDIYYDKGQCLYQFAEVILQTAHTPTIPEVMESRVFARKNIGFDKEKTIDHKDLKQFQDKFQKIGTIHIRERDRRAGGVHPVSDFEEFCRDWNNPQYGHKKSMRYKTQNLSEFLE